MRQIFFISIITIFLYSCKNRKVNIDPHYPNFEITVKDLKKNGWEISTMDDGVCVYSKRNFKPYLVFYLDINEDCEIVRSQEFYIVLNYPYQYKYETLQDNDKPINENELVSEIDSILSTFNAKKKSKFKFISSCRFTFLSENIDGMEIEWSLNLCRKVNKISSYFELNK